MIGLPLRTDPVGSIRNLLFRLKSIPGIEIWTAIGLLLVVSYWNAWLSDDAFISFRVVDNFVNGYGLRWNVDERVQVFTNPLLVLLLILPYSLWQNIVVISLIVSFLSCLGTILLLRKISSNGVAFLLAIGFLLSSKAFVDYLYSGLENSLNYFIQTFFFYIYWTKRDGSNDSRFPLLVLIASVGFVSRMDFVLIFVLPLFFRFYADVKSGKWDKTSLGKVLLAGLPAILWLLFAAFYYGSFLPNTYYAKTNVVDSFRSIIAQGFAYYRFQFVWDPISFASIPLLILLRISFGRNIGSFREGVLYSIPYSLYILSVGGDFMAGRFFGYIILLFGLSIARMDSLEWKEKVFAFAFLIIYSFAFSDSPIRMPDEDTISAKRVIGKEGITDERLYYYNLTSLISRGASSSLLIPLAEKRQILPPEKRVFVTRNIGFVGFLMGPKYHIVDFYALSDPLLSRIFGFGRIGHKIRAIPAGYLDSIESGKNQLSSSDLREYYEGIRVLTQADIFDSRRWDLFWNFQFGRQRRFYNVYQIDDKVVAKSIHDYFH